MEKALSELTFMLLCLNDDVRVDMEATGIYHLLVLSYLKEKGLFVAGINPFEIEQHRKSHFNSPCEFAFMMNIKIVNAKMIGYKIVSLDTCDERIHAWHIRYAQFAVKNS